MENYTFGLISRILDLVKGWVGCIDACLGELTKPPNVLEKVTSASKKYHFWRKMVMKLQIKWGPAVVFLRTQNCPSFETWRQDLAEEHTACSQLNLLIWLARNSSCLAFLVCHLELNKMKWKQLPLVGTFACRCVCCSYSALGQRIRQMNDFALKHAIISPKIKIPFNFLLIFCCFLEAYYYYFGFPAIYRVKEDSVKRAVFIIDPTLKAKTPGIVTGWNVYTTRGRRSQV